MKQYEYYLFDVDGTLLDTTELIYQSFRHTCKTFANLDVSRSQIIKSIGLTLRDQMTVHFGPISEEEFTRKSTEHMRYQMSIYKQYLELFPSVVPCLQFLKKTGKKCAVVTSRRRESLELYLKETGIYDYFDAIVTPEITMKHKPDPEPAFKALSLLGTTETSAALFIGDAEFDIECGRRAGMDTAFVNWSFTPQSELPSVPTYVIGDLTELCRDES